MENFILVEGVACLPDSFHANWIKENKSLTHDKWLMGILKNHVRKGMHVIDAGAHIGTHTLWYSQQVGDEGRVHAFEPNYSAYNCLHYNCRMQHNIRFHNVALGAESSSVEVVEIKENYGMTFTKPGGNTPCIPLDSLQLDRLDFMKIDCEGAEVGILKGAEKTISKFKPIMLIEINVEVLIRNNHTPDDVFNFLNKLQYKFENISGEPMTGSQFDLICKP